MQAITYPSKIAYGGGLVGWNKGYENGFGAGYGVIVGGYNYASQVVSASIIASNPNGVVLTGSGNGRGGGTRTIRCESNGPIRSAYGNESAEALSAWTVGVGFKHVLDAKGTYGGRGGGVSCFGNIYISSQYQYVVDSGFSVEGQYLKLQWPVEKIITRIGGAGISGGSGSFTQLANGYFTGPPTYKTTGKKGVYSIQDKTRLVYTSIETDITILVTGPHTTQKSKPENFLWVAGGLLGGNEWITTRVQEACVVYYDFRGDLGTEGGWPNYRRFGISSLTESHGSSIQTFTLGGIRESIPFSQETYSASSSSYGGKGQSFNTVVRRVVKQIPATYTEGTTVQENTVYWSSSLEDELWPIIDTYSTTYEKQTTTLSPLNGGMRVVANESHKILALTTDEDGDSYATTSSGNADMFGYITELHTSSDFSNSYYNVGAENHSTYINNFGFDGYSLTMPIELGYIHREHETSKRGYFYTDPDELFKNAKDVKDSLDYTTYQCYDAECIDFKLYADANAFQTAKTYNNSIVLGTRKQPRNADKRTMHTLTLQSVQGFFTSTKAKTNVTNPINFATPVGGFAKQSQNEYGEKAKYTHVGYISTKDKAGTATKLVPDGKNTYVPPILYDGPDLRVQGWDLGMGNYWYGYAGRLQPNQGV